MKINMIQCDICGKTVDYNNTKIKDMVSNKLLTGDYLYTDSSVHDWFKVNKLTMCGITKIKNVDENINPNCENNADITIKMDFDLCEDCLVELYKMINEYIKEARE